MKRPSNPLPEIYRPKLMTFSQFLVHRMAEDALAKAEEEKALVSPPEASKK
jgi:hypothetical protein